MQHVWRILLLTARTYRKTHASTRAAALSFSSLLGMGPLIALIVIIGSPILGRRDPLIAAKALNRVLHLIAPQIHEYERLSDSGRGGIAASQTAFNPKLTEILDGFVRGAHRGSAGTFGALSLAVIVFLLFGTIERSFNEIWDVPQGRSFFRTLLFHLIFLLAGSALFFSAAALMTATAFINVFIESSKMARPLWPVLHWTAPAASFLFLAAVLTISYRLIPNTRVRWGAAAIGALVVTVLLLINNFLAFLYLHRVLLTQDLYGSLGVIPILMLGLYVFWLFVLIGGQISFAVQNAPCQRPEPI